MDPRSVRSTADARALVDSRRGTHVKVGVVDLDGVLRGKYVSRDKLFSALDSSLGFCDVVLGWDVDDQAYDNVEFTGWHTGFPDAQVRILPETCREIPFEEGALFFLGEFAGTAEALCPRGVLRRVVARAADMGFQARGAFEYEFFVFEETPHSIREKGYRNLRPWTPGSFGYSVLRSSVGSAFYHALLDLGQAMDFPIEGLHTETGPGVLEACIGVDDALSAADKAVLFKSFTKALAQRNGLLATFMAKWSTTQPGQSGHVHVSLQDFEGRPSFYEEAGAFGMSDTMRHFVAGQQALMPELLAMVASTVNSYSRLVPGYWAPTSATWGVENRTVAIRAIPGSAKAQRVEYRVAAADANPYLAMAAAIASGLWGVEQKLEPSDPVAGNAYEAEAPPDHRLPATLWEAAQRFRTSEVAKDLFGAPFVTHFAASREWEERAYRKHVTDWELARYFEII